MLARELIELLQKKIKEHEPFDEALGELRVHIDVFKSVGGMAFHYVGLSPDISVETMPDGLDLLIFQKEAWGDNEGQITY